MSHLAIDKALKVRLMHLFLDSPMLSTTTDEIYNSLSANCKIIFLINKNTR